MKVLLASAIFFSGTLVIAVLWITGWAPLFCQALPGYHGIC